MLNGDRKNFQDTGHDRHVLILLALGGISEAGLTGVEVCQVLVAVVSGGGGRVDREQRDYELDENRWGITDVVGIDNPAMWLYAG